MSLINPPDLTMMVDALAEISDSSFGVDVTIGGNTVRATRSDNQRTINRYIPPQGLHPQEKQPIVFVFARALFDDGTLKQQTTFVCEGLPYKIDTVHPTPVQCPVVAFQQ